MSWLPAERRPKYFNVGPFLVAGNGEEVSPGIGFTLKHFLEAVTYQPRDQDILVVGYPKSGTTWINFLVFALRNGGKTPLKADVCGNLMIEMSGSAVVNVTMASDKFKYHMNTHLPYNLTPKNPKSKYLVIVRNPKDVCVSFYHHTKGFANFYDYSDGAWDDYFELFMAGLVDFGDWFDWVTSWIPHQHDHNVLMVTYEEMKEHESSALTRIASHIELQKELHSNPRLISNVMEVCCVKTMKQTVNPIYASRSGKKDLEFVRKGQVNDWRNIMSEEQSQRVSDKFRQKAKECPQLLSLWKDYSWL